MSEELKPCPFCGGKAVLLGGPQAQECHSVWCLDCSAKMQGGMQSEPLVEKWNARPAPAVQVPDAVAVAYGLLWHVNAGLDAPHGTPSLTPEKAAYEARKLLRDLMTKEQRGDGINAAREHMLAAAPAPATANEEHF